MKNLEMYWNDIPIEKKHAISYPVLMRKWEMNARRVRKILHELSLYDNGDDYILIRSGGGRGFYRTDDEATIKAYRNECLNKGKSVFAPVKKINRVLRDSALQFDIKNNLRVFREMRGLKQSQVCDKLKDAGTPIDNALLSKMENGVCLPTPAQLSTLAKIYECEPFELLNSFVY